MNITPERIQGAKAFFEEKLKDLLRRDKQAAAQDDPASNVHPIYLGKMVEPYYRTILALLDECEKTMAGGSGTVSEKSRHGSTPCAQAPGLSADERAFDAFTSRWCHSCWCDLVKESEQDLEICTKQCGLDGRRLRSRLSTPAPPAGEEERREMVYCLDHDWLWMERDGVNPMPSIEMRDKIRALILQPKATVTRDTIKFHALNFISTMNLPNLIKELPRIEGTITKMLRDIGVTVTEGEGK